MDDLISRQAAIDAILHNEEVYSNHFGDDPIDRYTVAIIDNDAQTLAQLPTIDPVKHGKWISCKERLPDKKGEYLCTIRYTTWNGKVDRGIFSGYYTKTNGWQIGEGIVIAWMPLPEPYKE